MTNERRDEHDAATSATETQPAPNISTERPRAKADDKAVKPTTTQPDPNISTEHAPEGSARRPSAGLDR